MHRVTLTELMVVVSRAPHTSDLYKVLWTLQARPGYPDHLGARSSWRVLLTHDAVFHLAPEEHDSLDEVALVELLTHRMFTPDMEAMLASCASSARAAHGWGRAAVEIRRGHADGRDGEAIALDELPWEALFGSRGISVVRRDRTMTSRRAPLTLPLKLCAVGVDEQELLDHRMREVIGIGAAVLHGELATADILHLGPRMAERLHIAHSRREWPPLLASVLDSDSEPSLPGMLVGICARLIVIHETQIHRSSASFAAWVQAVSGADAILCIAGRSQRPRQIYRYLVHGWPLDLCVRGRRGARSWRRPKRGRPSKRPRVTAILRCREHGETCVSISRILDTALGASATDLQSKRWTDVLGAASAPSVRAGPVAALQGEWWQALQHPAKALSARVQALPLDGEIANLRSMIELTREAELLAAEAVAVDEVLWHVAMSRAEHVDAASARVTEVKIVEPTTGIALSACAPLATNQPYRLTVQIVREAAAAAWVANRFPEDALRATFARLDWVKLSIVLYASSEGLRLDRRRSILRLPKLGNSDAVSFELEVQRPGAFAVRVCVFYGTVLLQAVVVEGHAGDRAPEARPLEAMLDYAASATFMQLDQLAQPAIAIWTNYGLNGTHWFGIFTGDRAAPANGLLVELSADDLAEVARGLSDALEGVALTNGPDLTARTAYRFEPPALIDEAQREDRARQLAVLARAGANAYAAVFTDVTIDLGHATTNDAALMLIARCRPDHRNLAWSALYDLPLDTNEPVVCDVFDRQLRSSSDLLDQPAQCRAQPACPLSDPVRAQRTVCPFGFWGIRYRIEQPLHHVDIRPPEPPPAPTQVVVRAADVAATVSISYDELEQAARTKARIGPPDRARELARIGVAFWPYFDDRAKQHLDAVMAFRRESDQPQVLDMLCTDPADIYYFFCHGEGESLGFQLRVGPRLDGDVITVRILQGRGCRWPSTGAAPLVFLNGCSTTALRSDIINKFVEQLRAMGASGVIGTEIRVHSYLAEDVGRRVLDALGKGDSIGDAFLQMRRALLREQYNPLGLAYTFFASAQLRI